MYHNNRFNFYLNNEQKKKINSIYNINTFNKETINFNSSKPKKICYDKEKFKNILNFVKNMDNELNDEDEVILIEKKQLEKLKELIKYKEIKNAKNIEEVCQIHQNKFPNIDFFNNFNVDSFLNEENKNNIDNLIFVDCVPIYIENFKKINNNNKFEKYKTKYLKELYKNSTKINFIKNKDEIYQCVSYFKYNNPDEFKQKLFSIFNNNYPNDIKKYIIDNFFLKMPFKIEQINIEKKKYMNYFNITLKEDELNKKIKKEIYLLFNKNRKKNEYVINKDWLEKWKKIVDYYKYENILKKNRIYK